MLDIDAQGTDLSLLQSLMPNALHRTWKVQIECQDLRPWAGGEAMPPWLYEGDVRNDCGNAQRLLEAHGFVLKQVTANCACAEFNILMERPSST